MATEIILPKFSASMRDASVKKWLKKEGEPIAEGEDLLSIAYGKTTGTISAPCSGHLLRIVVPEGRKAVCEEVIAYIGQEGEELPEIKSSIGTEKEEKKGEVLVIGGGPGGYVAAIRAAQLGGQVTLIEKEKMGGTCLNVGCIPTKALLHSAELNSEIGRLGQIGIEAENVKVNWKKVQEYKSQVSNQLSQGIELLMGTNEIRVIHGKASFVSASQVQVEKEDGTKELISVDKCIIASGSVPVIPPIPGVKESSNCVDSTGALSFEKIPKTLAVIGGGVIGVELASVYAKLGTKVSIIEMLPKLLPMMDGELTDIAKERLEKEGIRFFMETQVESVEDKGEETIVHARQKNGEPIDLLAEKVLVAVGRKPYTEGLALENAEIEMERGKILVNDRMETNVKGIFAIGDCVGQIMLAHTASAMGEAAAENALGKHTRYNPKSNPSCVYISPEFAGVGLTEEEAIAQKIDYETGRFPMTANGKSLIVGETDGWIKVLAHKRTKKVIGVHMLCARATDLIAEAALAVQMGASVRNIRETIHAHPTIAEAFREAVLAVEDNAIHHK